MKLAVYSLQRVLYEGEAASVTMKTIAGEITVLNHHRPLITMLSAGTLKIVDGKKEEHYIPVTSGFLEVSPENHAKLLVDEAVS